MSRGVTQGVTQGVAYRVTKRNAPELPKME